MLWRTAQVWKKDAKQPGSRERKERRRGTKWQGRNEERDKKQTERYGEKQKASKKRKTRKSTTLFRGAFGKYFVKAGLRPQAQSPRHFGWQPSGSLTIHTVLLPQSRDCSYCVSRQILPPPQLWLQKTNDLPPHEFAHRPDLCHQPRLAVTCASSWRLSRITPAITDTGEVAIWLSYFVTFVGYSQTIVWKKHSTEPSFQTSLHNHFQISLDAEWPLLFAESHESIQSRQTWTRSSNWSRITSRAATRCQPLEVRTWQWIMHARGWSHVKWTSKGRVGLPTSLSRKP